MSAATAARPRAGLLLAVLLVAFVGLAASAMLRTSTTFDEIILPAAGARGYATGDFGMVLDHPPVMQYVYGLPLRLMDLRYPPEAGRHWSHIARYQYAQALLWGSGNAPERIVAASRLVAVAIGALLVWATYALGRRSLGQGPALLAAALVAFLPDVLAHSGITYNDVPVTLALFAAVFAADRAVRAPSAASMALAALLAGIATGVKLSGAIVLPILAVLGALEAVGRRGDRAWWKAIARGLPVYALALYGTLVAIYLGDFHLGRFLDLVRTTAGFGNLGRPALILGKVSHTGFWYFFPVAFLLKTPAALHALALVALAGAWLALRRERWAALAAHRLRAPVVAIALLGAALLTSKFDIGFRHAMPVLPFVCLLVAAGVARAWSAWGGAGRAVIAVLVAADIASAVSAYPFFISYLSEYVRGRPVYEALVDSSTDWGQGLVALRQFMRERGIRSIYLGYFGSALPEGYGIDYVSLPSFFRLPDHPPDPSARPRYVAVSATLLAGLYLKDDPYAKLRAERPVAVVARTIYVYEMPP